MQNIYSDGTYLKSTGTWHLEDAPFKAKEILKLLSRNNINPKTVCEVGCGSGQILEHLSKELLSTQFFGYEISPQAFTLCESLKTEDRVQYYLEDLLCTDLSFDLGLAIDVFEHVEDYFDFLRRFKSKSHYKIYRIPLELSAQTVFRDQSLVDAWNSVGHIHYFTEKLALKALEHCEYKIIDYMITAGAVDLPTKSFKRKLAKIPRKLVYSISPSLCSRTLGGCSMIALVK